MRHFIVKHQKRPVSGFGSLKREKNTALGIRNALRAFISYIWGYF